MVWLLVCWVVVFWRLGYPSLWDPDEAHYAQASKEMLEQGNWLAPTYNGSPFFDKPILFYTVQMVSFALFGANEFGARILSAAVPTVLLFMLTWWLGRRLFDATTGHRAALMLALLPATFGLSAYAILDMWFTVLVFGGAAFAAVAVVEDRRRLQYPAYVLLALAVLMKGPLALVISGVAFLASLAVRSVRQRLIRLQWMAGLALIAVIAAPWFIWMWIHSGDAFIRGYFLSENIWLYAIPLYGKSGANLSYPALLAVGLLPWTPVLIGRCVDLARRQPSNTGEKLLGAWVLAVIGFFSLSRFKLDHYLYPAVPALCLLMAHAWERCGERPRDHVGTWIGVILTGPVLLVLGVHFWLVGIPALPFDLPRVALVVPIVVVLGGLCSLVQHAWRRWEPGAMPWWIVAALLGAYAGVIVIGFPAVEQLKPVKELGGWVAGRVRPADHVGGYRLNRWECSWRFYADHPTDVLETPEEITAFFKTPGRHYCLILRRAYREMRDKGLLGVTEVAISRVGVFSTTGRRLREASPDRLVHFLVITDAPAAGSSPERLPGRTPIP